MALMLALRSGRSAPGSFLVLISPRGSVDLKAYCASGRVKSIYKPKTSSGIEPSSSRLAA
jgi:hypothetical protein